MLLAASAHQAELWAPTGVWVQPRAKPPVFTLKALGLGSDFGMSWKQCGFCTSIGIKMEKWPYVQELLHALLLLAAFASLISRGILNSTLWKRKEITLRTLPTGNAARK